MQKTSLTRRRFLTISAVAGAALAVSRGRSAAAQQVETWAGSAMGSSASIRLYHHTDATVVRRVLARCAAEAERLEQIFSLYRSDSELVRLNKAGVLDAPAHDLVVLLGESMAIAGRTNGAFDPTVQPLFRAYADHFGVPGRSADGPPRQVIADALSRVGWRDMVAEPGRIAFVRPGMELTLNGIAQGYITDRITDMLKAAGFERVLVNMGKSAAWAAIPTAGHGRWQSSRLIPWRRRTRWCHWRMRRSPPHLLRGPSLTSRGAATTSSIPPPGNVPTPGSPSPSSRPVPPPRTPSRRPSAQ